MADPSKFRLSKAPLPWIGGEPRVFTVYAEDDLSTAFNLEGASLLTIVYQGGGLSNVFASIAEAADVAHSGSFQALLENLGELADEKPLVVNVRNGVKLLADVGPALLHIMASWERFARHGTGVHSMYLVVEAGSRATTHSAFYPGGTVNWL